MKPFLIAAAALAVTTGALLPGAAEAAPYKGAFGQKLTRAERMAIARDKAHLNALMRRVRADGRITAWERARLRAAQARHRALVYRYMHN